MSTDQETQTDQPGSPASFTGGDRGTSFTQLEPGVEFHTHRGMVAHDDLIGSAWVSQSTAHRAHSLCPLRPSTDDMGRNLSRITQIVYPKDASHPLMAPNIAPRNRVVEVGSGSGGLREIMEPTDALESTRFGRIGVEELPLRPHKTVSARLRPRDRLMLHTRHLVIARKLIPLEEY